MPWKCVMFYVCTSPPLSIKLYWVYKYSPHQHNSPTPHTKYFYIIKFTIYLNKGGAW